MAGQAADKDGKQPVPPASDLAKLESTVQDLYKSQFAKRDDADRSALGKRLLREANDSTNDVATKFVLLRDAGGIALAAGDVPTALAALDARGAQFDENIHDLRLSGPRQFRHVALMLLLWGGACAGNGLVGVEFPLT